MPITGLTLDTSILEGWRVFHVFCSCPSATSTVARLICIMMINFSHPHQLPYSIHLLSEQLLTLQFSLKFHPRSSSTLLLCFPTILFTTHFFSRNFFFLPSQVLIPSASQPLPVCSLLFNHFSHPLRPPCCPLHTSTSPLYHAHLVTC